MTISLVKSNFMVFGSLWIRLYPPIFVDFRVTTDDDDTLTFCVMFLNDHGLESSLLLDKVFPESEFVFDHF